MCVCVAAIFLLYAKLEEEHGLARHAMSVYDRATKAVLPEEQHEVSTACKLFSKYITNFHLGFCSDAVWLRCFKGCLR